MLFNLLMNNIVLFKKKIRIVKYVVLKLFYYFISVIIDKMVKLSMLMSVFYMFYFSVF